MLALTSTEDNPSQCTMIVFFLPTTAPLITAEAPIIEGVSAAEASAIRFTGARRSGDGKYGIRLLFEVILQLFYVFLPV